MLQPPAKTIHHVMLEQRLEKLEKDQQELHKSVHGDPFTTGALPLRVMLNNISMRLGRLETGQWVMAAVMVVGLIVYVVSN